MTGSCYFRGFVGSKAAQNCWLGEDIEGWQDLVATLAGLERQHPHTVYGGLHKYLQKKWAFMQRVILDIGMAFQVVEDALR